MALWFIRIIFLGLCTVAGYGLSQARPEMINGGVYGIMIGFGLGGLLIAIDEMVKGLSLRAFSAATFGLFLGALAALLVDHSQLFVWVSDEKTLWTIRLGLYLSFGYIGMILAMRSNKEDFSLIIPYVRFASQTKPDYLLVLDTSVIIDGRIADLIESGFLEGRIIVPKFVLRELQKIADSTDPIRRARGRRGLEMLNRIQQSQRVEVKIHEGDFPEETEMEGKLVRLSKALSARLYTNNYNLGKIAELQAVPCVNLNELAKTLKPVTLPGESLNLKIVREGKDKGQGVGYMNDGTMVVVNHAQALIGQQVHVQVQSLIQTGAGVIVFAEVKPPGASTAE
jgi:uncharacterized protein YacL